MASMNKSGADIYKYATKVASPKESENSGAATSVADKSTTEVVPPGYKHTKVGVIPEEWEVVRLGDVASRSTQKNIENIVDVVFSNSALDGIVMQTDYFDKDIANRNNLSGYYVVNPGDFVYNPRISKYAPAGPINRNNTGKIGIVSPLYTVFCIENRNCIRFFEYYFKSTLWLSYMYSIANYGARHDRMNITINDFMKMPLPLPPLKEQQKIAQILSAWDEAIAKLEALIEEKERFKKGLMQKLLSAKLRFPGFEGEWEEVRLGEVAKIYKGKGISKNDISDDGLECIRYGELYTIYGEKIEEVVSKTLLRKEELFLSRINDILIPSSGETAIDIATASCVMKDNVAIGGDINIIRTNQNGVFLSYWLNTVAKKAIASIAQGVSVVHLYKDQLKSLKVKLPSIDEQKKIVEVLTAMDNEIKLLIDEIETLKEQKRGLMQKLLTGEVRVKA